jgi:small subunit ribosomal protein S18
MTREARKPKVSPFKKRKRKPCYFCVEKRNLDYKDAAFVKRFMTDRGKIAPRRLSGCCALHQRMVANAIKRARQIGTVPYVVD